MKIKDLHISQDEPLYEQDTASQTYGCRHKNPNVCLYCYMPDTCAFVTSDKICRKPPNTWKRKFLALKNN